MSELFDFRDFISCFPELMKRLPKTIELIGVSFLIGLLIGFIVAIIRIYKVKGLNKICGFYVSFIRGTPIIVQLYLISYSIPKIIYYLQMHKGYLTGIEVSVLSAEIYGIVTLALNIGAYLSEAIRASIESVDAGQFEAARMLGMTTYQMMSRIIIPQAMKVAVPNIGNTLVSTTKDTAVLFMVGIVDIMGQAKIHGSRTLSILEAYIAVAIIYWIMCALLSKGIVLLERRLKIADKAIV